MKLVNIVKAEELNGIILGTVIWTLNFNCPFLPGKDRLNYLEFYIRMTWAMNIGMDEFSQIDRSRAFRTGVADVATGNEVIKAQ